VYFHSKFQLFSPYSDGFRQIFEIFQEFLEFLSKNLKPIFKFQKSENVELAKGISIKNLSSLALIQPYLDNLFSIFS
jgi:hypothetical protein